MTTTPTEPPTTNDSDIVARVSEALALYIFARHVSGGSARGRIDTNAVLKDYEIPAVIRGFLQLGLRLSIAERFQPLRASFYLKPEIEEPVVQSLMAGLLIAGEMPSAEFQTRLKGAVELCYAFVVGPESTLASLITEGSNEAEINARFFDILENVQAYRYLPDVVIAWAERQKAEGIESTDAAILRGLFRSIDRAVIGAYHASDLTKLLAPLFDFYALAGVPTINRSVLTEFFRDRGMFRAAQAVRTSPQSEFSQEELAALLAEILGVVAPPSEVNQQSFALELVAEAAEARPSEPDYADFIHELREAGVPVPPPRRLSELEASPQIHNRPESTTGAIIADGLEQPNLQAGLQHELDISDIIPSTKSETHKPPVTLEGLVAVTAPEAKDAVQNRPALPSLQELIRPKARRKFIRKLFDGSESDYEHFIGFINASENWKQASIYVDAIFLRHRINPFSKRAVRFSDLVYSRYRKSAH